MKIKKREPCNKTANCMWSSKKERGFCISKKFINTMNKNFQQVITSTQEYIESRNPQVLIDIYPDLVIDDVSEDEESDEFFDVEEIPVEQLNIILNRLNINTNDTTTTNVPLDPPIQYDSDEEEKKEDSPPPTPQKPKSKDSKFSKNLLTLIKKLIKLSQNIGNGGLTLANFTIDGMYGLWSQIRPEIERIITNANENIKMVVKTLLDNIEDYFSLVVGGIQQHGPIVYRGAIQGITRSFGLLFNTIIPYLATISAQGIYSIGTGIASIAKPIGRVSAMAISSTANTIASGVKIGAPIVVDVAINAFQSALNALGNIGINFVLPGLGYLARGGIKLTGSALLFLVKFLWRAMVDITSSALNQLSRSDAPEVVQVTRRIRQRESSLARMFRESGNMHMLPPGYFRGNEMDPNRRYYTGGKRKKKSKKNKKHIKKRIRFIGRSSVRRKHSGINQKTGRLNKGYKYSGKKLKSGLPQIIKIKKKKFKKKQTKK
jgi:hypothetical protein